MAKHRTKSTTPPLSRDQLRTRRGLFSSGKRPLVTSTTLNTWVLTTEDSLTVFMGDKLPAAYQQHSSQRSWHCPAPYCPLHHHLGYNLIQELVATVTLHPWGFVVTEPLLASGLLTLRQTTVWDQTTMKPFHSSLATSASLKVYFLGKECLVYPGKSHLSVPELKQHISQAITHLRLS